MASGETSAMRRFLLWDYARATWQYDVMVALILAFVFLTPRELFRDQPKPSNIVRMPAEHGAKVFWLEPQLLDFVAEGERGAKVERELKSRFGERETVVRVEPLMGSEHEVQGYMAYTKP
jgi:hypothetical protein